MNLVSMILNAKMVAEETAEVLKKKILIEQGKFSSLSRFCNVEDRRISYMISKASVNYISIYWIKRYLDLKGLSMIKKMEFSENEFSYYILIKYQVACKLQPLQREFETDYVNRYFSLENYKRNFIRRTL